MSAAISLRERYMQKLQQMTDKVGLSDLTIDELAAFTVLLTLAYARVVAGQPSTSDQLGKWPL
ncbi:hypothetical protein A5709_01870 [Mycobacterium sp. E1386]|nr:hypothetical protein A5709_01870 [Mycobacterium sp. E1386]